MQSFTYCVPTEIEFGRDCWKNVAAHVKKTGAKRVGIVYGSKRIEKQGLLGQIIQALNKNGIEAMALGGVVENPRLEHVYELKEGFSEFEPDLILAVGGGSVIDTAKALAHALANPEVDVWNYWLGTEKLEKTMPVGVILTIPAAGSETSDSAVLTREETHQKRGLNTELNRPAFALMDPVLSSTLSKWQITNGVTDIMMHTMERYFTNTEGNELTDALAEALLRTVIANGQAVVENREDEQAMSEIMWAGSLSHNNLTGLGRPKDFSVHQLGHELSAMFDVTHGASLAATWGSWARKVMPTDPARFARFARNVWGVQEEDDLKAANEGIKKTEEYFRSLGMPTSLRELKGLENINDQQLVQLANNCSRNGARSIGYFCPLDEQGILEVYRMAADR